MEKKGTLVSTSFPVLDIQEHCVTWRKGKPFLEHLNITEDLNSLMQWVTNAPDDTIEIEKYINDSIDNEVNE